MRHLPLLALVSLLPTTALAERVTCESQGNQRVECDMNTSGPVMLERQLSRSACVENQSWGANRSSIWVSNGCRGVFVSGRDAESGGTAASSAGESPSEVTCESQDGRRAECDMNTRGVVRVVRQLSRTACVQDQNWGLNRSSIWVDGGCRAVFALEGAGGGQPSRADIAREDAQFDSSGRAPAAAIRACNGFADQGYDGTIVSQNAMKPGWWEIVLRFEEYRYVCNVSSSGQVESFDKIN